MDPWGEEEQAEQDRGLALLAARRIVDVSSSLQA